MEFIQKMITQFNEEQDAFIFETIRPFCEKVVQTKVEKRVLEHALLNSLPKHISVVQGHDICPTCHLDITDSVKGMPECYCKRCGQHILRRWEIET